MSKPVVRLVDAGTAGKGDNTRLTGHAFGHENFKDGMPVVTGPILKWERDRFPHWGESAAHRYEVANWKGMNWGEIESFLAKQEPVAS